MNAQLSETGAKEAKQKMFLSSESILRYFLGTDDHVDTLIKCRGSEFEIMTYDYNLYEAIGSIKPYDEFKTGKLVKFLEVGEVLPFNKAVGSEKPILREERIDALRNLALKNAGLSGKEKEKENDSEKQ